MKRIRIIAVIAALFTTLALYLYLVDLKKPETVQRKPVVVAASEIKAGQAITDGMLAIKQLPEEAVLPGAATAKEDVVGLISSTDVSAGQQVLTATVFKAELSKSSLAYTVEKGMRAITVPVDQVTGVAGFIKPKDRVDVMAIVDIDSVLSPEEFSRQLDRKNSTEEPQQTASSAPSSGQSQEMKLSFSMILLQDVEVLATGQNMKRDELIDIAPTVVETVTLSVTPEQALRLNLILAKGIVRLMLRTPGDTDMPDLEGVSVANLVDSDDIRILTLLGELAPTPGPTASPKASQEAGGTAQPSASPAPAQTPTPAASPKK